MEKVGFQDGRGMIALKKLIQIQPPTKFWYSVVFLLKNQKH